MIVTREEERTHVCRQTHTKHMLLSIPTRPVPLSLIGAVVVVVGLPSFLSLVHDPAIGPCKHLHELAHTGAKLLALHVRERR